MPNTVNFDFDLVCTDTSLPIDHRDLVVDDLAGVRFVFDTGDPYSFPSQGAPANGAIIRDLADISAPGAFRLGAGKAIGYVGGGLDFSTYSTAGGFQPCYVEIPAAVLANIWGGGAPTAQQFLVAMYLRLPTLPNWNALGIVLPFFQSGATTGGYPSEADLVSFGMGPGTAPGTLTARRQTNGGATVDAFSITPGALDYGAIVQLAFWRTAAGQGFRLKSVNSNILLPGAVGSNNTGDFSGKLAKFGVGPAFWGSAAASSYNWRLYRGLIENLLLSGRDPAAVLDADWTRFLARMTAGLYA